MEESGLQILADRRIEHRLVFLFKTLRLHTILYFFTFTPIRRDVSSRNDRNLNTHMYILSRANCSKQNLQVIMHSIRGKRME